ncbi:MAG: nitrogenase molybdenum-iron protein subunit beta [Planctomycetota bacterium]|jgi:nitrogenase molybdenum-iron protein beta chain|nr:nitrogenase molybdenum-iron protein subunit beta [Planctomycetota bacterium]
MLLRHTEADAPERKALTINPAKTCQPIGAMYAALGVHGCLPHSHGSQGCCSYHRSQLTRHYKEPVLAATSSFTEGSSVFGGQSNLLQAISNIFSIYDADVIAVHTTCLSETIGDDINQIVRKAKEDGLIPEGKYIFHANTPSYQGSQVTGFASMCKSMMDSFAEPADKPGDHIAIVPGWVEPADMREIRRIVEAFGVEVTLAPDTSGVLDTGLTGTSQYFPDGGTTIDELKACGSARTVISLGPSASGPAGRALESRCKVPCEVLELPIGLQGTDRFIQSLSVITGKPIPEQLKWERSRLVDLMSDMGQYFYGKSAALWGDPDQIVALSEFLCDLSMFPKYAVTGTPGKGFMKRMEKACENASGPCRYEEGQRADMHKMHSWIKADKPDVLIGGTHGKYIARDEDIPLVRHGFPILDRIGHQYFNTVGYTGGMRLAEQILNCFLDRQDRDAPEERFELVM